MANFARQYSSASPVLAIPPQPYYQTQLSAGTFGRHNSSPMSLSAAQSALIAPVRSTGRKRSRDEASINLEPDLLDVVTQDSQEHWVNGQGMILSKAGKGCVADASTQSTLWLEDKNEQEHQPRYQNEASQPQVRSHKSQRLDQNLSHATRPKTSISPSSSNSCHKGSAGNDFLRIDKFTIHLGIGWRKLSSEEHIQAAARGWARFIENNFALSKVIICLESKGLQSYLVEASDGYYLFTENLRHGRLVSRTAEGALQNLQLSPPNFEGPELGLMAGGDRQSNALTDSAMVID
ncbi:uncharacterized protein MAM_02964 [Metarhizium album ARSEF 1941]|uniref:Uncharacterized protein n=1 Tax=Metarhizium album (strain ARSEF 1941) TaxID=1081103 RepID=A0A0B2WT98_METAS|nr:uncharacterized protein MAM_02964 [Metarhizium album ARSEF 1941]KHN99266.1 hypothetical protein MAM_02964 [Metarhizium album ARSEF 1941]